MIKEALINQALKSLSKLPEDKIKTVLEYAEFLVQKYEEDTLNQGFKKITNDSKAYAFLNEEEDLYTVSDLKEEYK